MEYYIVTISTSYSIEEFLIPVQENEEIEIATDKALSSIAFCEDYEIVNSLNVDKDYMTCISDLKKEYFYLTGDKVEDVFTCGEYATLENILSEIIDIKRRKSE